MHSLAETLQSLLGLDRELTQVSAGQMALRAQAGITDASVVRLATLERGGSISVLKAGHPPRVIDVAVADGVQTVRAKLE